MTPHEPLDEAAESPADSPCTGVCVIDPMTQCCQGCFRTLGEIAAWSSSSVEQRREILHKLERRKTHASG
jgi:hypothetical protein